MRGLVGAVSIAAFAALAAAAPGCSSQTSGPAPRPTQVFDSGPWSAPATTGGDCSLLANCCPSLSTAADIADCEAIVNAGDQGFEAPSCAGALCLYTCPGFAAGCSPGSSGGGSSSGASTTSACGMHWPSAACAACIDASCCTVIQNCQSDPGCTALLACLARCGNSATCKTSCQSNAPPSGLAAYNGYATCYVRACGTACG